MRATVGATLIVVTLVVMGCDRSTRIQCAADFSSREAAQSFGAVADDFEFGAIQDTVGAGKKTRFVVIFGRKDDGGRADDLEQDFPELVEARGGKVRFNDTGCTDVPLF